MNKNVSAEKPTQLSFKNTATVHQPCAYLLVNHQNGAIYTGVTSCLIEQVWKHKHHLIEGFSKKYDIHTLVWYEPYDTLEAAYKKAKSLKDGPFEIKQATVERTNPKWRDLYDELCAQQLAPEQKTA